MNPRCKLFIALSALVFANLGFGQSRPLMKSGAWEVVDVTETEGSTARRTVTSRLCYSDADVALPARVIPPHRGQEMKCEVREVKADQAGITWKLACKGHAEVLEGVGSMEPGPTSYTASVRLKSKSARKSDKIEQKISGKWIGDCK